MFQQGYPAAGARRGSVISPTPSLAPSEKARDSGISVGGIDYQSLTRQSEFPFVFFAPLVLTVLTQLRLLPTASEETAQTQLNAARICIQMSLGQMEYETKIYSKNFETVNQYSSERFVDQDGKRNVDQANTPLYKYKELIASLVHLSAKLKEYKLEKLDYINGLLMDKLNNYAQHNAPQGYENKLKKLEDSVVSAVRDKQQYKDNYTLYRESQLALEEQRKNYSFQKSIVGLYTEKTQAVEKEIEEIKAKINKICEEKFSLRINWLKYKIWEINDALSTIKKQSEELSTIMREHKSVSSRKKEEQARNFFSRDKEKIDRLNAQQYGLEREYCNNKVIYDKLLLDAESLAKASSVGSGRDSIKYQRDQNCCQYLSKIRKVYDRELIALERDQSKSTQALKLDLIEKAQEKAEYGVSLDHAVRTQSSLQEKIASQTAKSRMLQNDMESYRTRVGFLRNDLDRLKQNLAEDKERIAAKQKSHNLQYEVTRLIGDRLEKIKRELISALNIVLTKLERNFSDNEGIAKLKDQLAAQKESFSRAHY